MALLLKLPGMHCLLRDHLLVQMFSFWRMFNCVAQDVGASLCAGTSGFSFGVYSFAGLGVQTTAGQWAGGMFRPKCISHKVRGPGERRWL